MQFCCNNSLKIYRKLFGFYDFCDLYLHINSNVTKMLELSKVARMILRDRKLKQEIARFCGVTENTIYHWLKTDAKDLLRLDILELISKETGVPADDLVCKVQPEAA